MRPLGDGASAAIREAAETLAAQGVPSPEHDARVLAEHVLGDRSLTARFDDGTLQRFRDLVRRRAAREPLQHLTGEAPFRHLVLAVGPGAFVPRPETELLVDLVLRDCGPDRVAVDLCAGTGAIACAIAQERPGTQVHAVEASADALPWLAQNAGEVVTVHHADVASFAGVEADVVVSNPPYLPTGLALDPEVEADPAMALWGGPTGLDTIEVVVDCGLRLLVPGGLLALEHDASHQPQVLDLLRHKGFEQVEGHRDLTGRDRYATGRMSP